MPDGHFDPAKDASGATVYIGAQVPEKLYRLVDREAAKKMVNRSDVIRWALAARYKDPTSREATL